MSIFSVQIHNVADAVQACKCLADLRANARHLNNRGNQHADERDVHHQITQRHGVRLNSATAKENKQRADCAHNHGGKRRHRARTSDALFDVGKQTPYTR